MKKVLVFLACLALMGCSPPVTRMPPDRSEFIRHFYERFQRERAMAPFLSVEAFEE